MNLENDSTSSLFGVRGRTSSFAELEYPTKALVNGEAESSLTSRHADFARSYPLEEQNKVVNVKVIVPSTPS